MKTFGPHDNEHSKKKMSKRIFFEKPAPIPEKRFAAIDIGSNAVRLLLASVFEYGEKPTFKKMSLTRVPLRLGDDAFKLNRISDRKADELVGVMGGFRQLINAYRPVAYMACATSAMRGAENGMAIQERILDATDINVNIIDGRKEARIIFENRSAERFGGHAAYLYADVGGGSTELTIFSRGENLDSASFDIGTIRLLQGQVTGEHWEAMKRWLKSSTKSLPAAAAIGSGGNINKIFRMAGLKNGKPIDANKIKKVQRVLKNYPYAERVTILNLRPDRADVIIPASVIYLRVLKWASINALYVPVVGLADGIVRMLYDWHKKNVDRHDDQKETPDQVTLEGIGI
jgi:exopolyphosphatase/guanosine-5'-triphosphate,3'-diphosphate pyrophosphatase